MRRLDARMALVFALTASASALSGLLPAIGVLILSAGLAAASGFPLNRLLPLAGSFAFFLLLIPLAPGPAVEAVVEGLAISSAVVVSISSARWDRLVATLQGVGVGRHAVAFLSITLSHLDAAGRDARVAFDALLLRGGFRGARGFGRSTSLLLARTLRRAFERADRTAEALELRGFAGRVPPLPALRAEHGNLAAGAASLLAIAVAVGSRLPCSR